MAVNPDDRIWKMAQRRVSFRRHLTVYIIVNIALIIIWYLTWDNEAPRKATTYWFLYPLCGWGIGVALHYWNAYHDDESSVEKEYKRLHGRKKDFNSTDLLEDPNSLNDIDKLNKE